MSTLHTSLTSLTAPLCRHHVPWAGLLFKFAPGGLLVKGWHQRPAVLKMLLFKKNIVWIWAFSWKRVQIWVTIMASESQCAVTSLLQRGEIKCNLYNLFWSDFNVKCLYVSLRLIHLSSVFSRHNAETKRSELTHFCPVEDNPLSPSSK